MKYEKSKWPPLKHPYCLTYQTSHHIVVVLKIPLSNNRLNHVAKWSFDRQKND